MLQLSTPKTKKFWIMNLIKIGPPVKIRPDKVRRENSLNSMRLCTCVTEWRIWHPLVMWLML